MLYVVATPIGNLKDITLRALEVLKEVDFILAEDTRVTKRLLEHYGIDKKMISYHHHTGEKKMAELTELIKNNKVALVTDAGTPGISDPGGLLIKALKHKNIKSNQAIQIIPIPGVSAVAAALSISGFPTDEFVFRGFVPHKNKRLKFLTEVLAEERTVVFYESCHRIIKCLEQLREAIADRRELYSDKKFMVCRELTKQFESIYRGNIDEVLDKVGNDPVKGEYVVVVH